MVGNVAFLELLEELESLDLEKLAIGDAGGLCTSASLREKTTANNYPHPPTRSPQPETRNSPRATLRVSSPRQSRMSLGTRFARLGRLPMGRAQPLGAVISPLTNTPVAQLRCGATEPLD